MSHQPRQFAASAPAPDVAVVLQDMQTSRTGLDGAEAVRRLADMRTRAGKRTHVSDKVTFLLDTVRNPLTLLLLCVLAVSTVMGDVVSSSMIMAMIVIGAIMRYVQEVRSSRAVEALRRLVRSTATVIRQGAEERIPAEDLVPGDIVRLSAGDLVPADVHLIDSDDLHVDQHILTGEAMPIEKSASATPVSEPLDDPRLCFRGSTIQAGYATAVVTRVGGDTFFGSIARSVAAPRSPTAFDVGIRSFTLLMVRIIVILVPFVFLANGLLRGDWMEALLFATAVAVGITPEMLPMIITVNLSKGAIAMARRKVIVKHLDSIQNLGAMDVLCTDKTGTLTQGRIVLMHHVRPDGSESEDVLLLGYLNSSFESGLRNIMDEAVLEHAHLEDEVRRQQWQKLDEQPFDFVRRRLSVLVKQPGKPPVIICKGALEEVLACCTNVPDGALAVADELSAKGFRIVAVARRELPDGCTSISEQDESNLTLEGFLAFFDPPKESSTEALRQIAAANIDVKILTGDRLAVTQYISNIVGLNVRGQLTGAEIDVMSDAELSAAVESTTIFAKLTPMHKERVIDRLRSNGHVVGFMGDGINDAPALRKADVGISVDEAVDIAKESSDLVLLEHNLAVLHDGVLEGRRIFGNIVKYLRMAASSNVGNMLSVTGASLLLPFLPMLPVQIMLNNLLYDLSQTTLPSDSVEESWLLRPRHWSLSDIRRAIIVFGPLSSLFDYATFAILLWPLHALNNPSLFHTGWFVESLCSQLLIVFLLRSHLPPWRAARPGRALIIASLLVLATAVILPYSALAGDLGLVPLPFEFWGWLVVILVSYMLCSLPARRFLQETHTEV
ncbi:MAG: magnesium-translocating P-type ATPase [Candidatus Kapabacteria bacterium]|nr:magnesium-translocating P-type ATPase [Candidatus Kapabacteria bacterium]